MAVVGTNLTANQNTVASSFTTASITPASNALILALVGINLNGGATPNTPTLSGNSLTWVQVATVALSDSSKQNLTLFRALGASPTAGAVTISCGGQTESDCYWSVNQFTGVNTAGTNGSGAIVQNATNTQTTAGTSFAIPLSAFASGLNATFGGMYMNDSGPGIVVGSNFTSLSNVASNHIQVTEYAKTNQTNVDFTFSSTTRNFLGIAVEIKAAPGANFLPFL